MKKSHDPAVLPDVNPKEASGNWKQSTCPTVENGIISENTFRISTDTRKLRNSLRGISLNMLSNIKMVRCGATVKS